MSTTSSYSTIVFRIRNDGEFKNYIGNNIIGIFEFHAEKNARKYIKEKNLKNVVIEEIRKNYTESITQI